MQIDFTIRSRDVRGYIAVVLNLRSPEMLRALIKRFIEGLLAAPAAQG